MIVFKYLVKEVLKSQLAVLSVLLTIFISQQFVRTLADASDGEFPASLVMTLIGLNLPELSMLIIPLSLFLGILLAHGRMYADNEMVVFHSVGVSEWYVTRVTLILAIANSLLTAYLSLYVAPWAEEQQRVILSEARSEASLAVLIPGRFQRSPNGDAVLFIEKMNKENELSNVFVAQVPEEGEVLGQANLVIAKGGRVVDDGTGGQRLMLTDGKRYQASSDQLDYQVIRFGGYQMQLKEQEINERTRKLSALSLPELLNTSGPEAVAEFNWRLAIPLAIPLLTLIAVPLARVNVRQGKFAKLFPAILLYLGYFGLMIAGRKALQDEVIPAYLGMWWIHASALLMGIFLLGKDRPIGTRISGVLKRRGVKA